MSHLKQKQVIKYLHPFYPIIDHTWLELNKRFTDNDPILETITYLVPKHEQFLNKVQHYGLNFEVLKAEMCIFKHTIQCYENEKKCNNITHVYVRMLVKFKFIFQECFKLYIIAVNNFCFQHTLWMNILKHFHVWVN